MPLGPALNQKETFVKLRTLQSGIALGLAVHLGALNAASPAIGTIVAKGSFRLDNATVNGNATLFEGATLETAQAGSSIELNSGARVLLASSSKGKLFGDHLVLEKGQSHLERGAGFRFEALGLTIRPATGTSTGRVQLAGANRIQVGAVTGAFRVLNSRGTLIANIATGSTLEFEPQTTATMTRVTGILRSRNGRFVITDETTNVTVEVAGANLGKEVGNRVLVSGSLDASETPVSEASQFVRVSQVTRLARGPARRSVGGAAPAGVGGAAAKGGVLGASTSTIAIVGGVAAAATLGGLAASDQLPGQAANPPVSR
jgi:hypothetical protein